MSARKVEKVIEPINAPFEQVVARLVDSTAQYAFFDVPKHYPHSPLRYPGGKNRAVKAIYSCIPANETTLCSPFLGGGSIELACSTRMQVYGYDVFSPLVDFWQVLLDNQELLAKRVERYYPLSRTKFYSLQKRYTTLKDKVERAAAFFVLNRSSFSGTTLSGGMSPGHPRFTLSAIERLRSFQATNFEVGCADFRESITNHPDAFLYLDPPYMNGHELYGLKGDTHKDFKHQELADILHNRERWIMSYNDCTTIRELYPDNPILSLEWVYGMSKNKKSSEVLILSRDLAV
jgi:DNA adenine methylase